MNNFFKVEFTDPDFLQRRDENYIGILGENMNVRVSWSVSNDPIADRLKWFLSKCAVKSLNDQARMPLIINK